MRFNYLDALGLMDFPRPAGRARHRQLAEPPGHRRDPDLLLRRQAPTHPERASKASGGVRQIDRAGLVLMGLSAIVLPIIVTAPSRQLLYTSSSPSPLCALSLTVLTGWGGQLSPRPDGLRGDRRTADGGVLPGVNVDLRR